MSVTTAGVTPLEISPQAALPNYPLLPGNYLFCSAILL
jgi:hypothetical protein